jgi:hypothetical protein
MVDLSSDWLNDEGASTTRKKSITSFSTMFIEHSNLVVTV